MAQNQKDSGEINSIDALLLYGCRCCEVLTLQGSEILIWYPSSKGAFQTASLDYLCENHQLERRVKKLYCHMPSDLCRYRKMILSNPYEQYELPPHHQEDINTSWNVYIYGVVCPSNYRSTGQLCLRWKWGSFNYLEMDRICIQS